MKLSLWLAPLVPLVLTAFISPLANAAAANAVQTLAVQPPAVQTREESFADLGPVAVISSTTVPPLELLLVLDSTTAIPPPLLELARQGQVIAHIPLQQFLDRAGHNDCLTAVTLLDVFSQHLQQEFRFPHYQRPWLIGLDAAAPFALATLAQAPAGLFEAGIGVRFRPELTLPAPLCPASALAVQNLGGRQFRLGTTTPATRWQTLPDLNTLAATLAAPAQQAAGNAAQTRIDDLPLVELPAAEKPASGIPSDTFAILISGDGGWANIDKDVGETLSRAGLPVVGWNSLQYFWRKKSPEQAGADLGRVIAHYQHSWRRPRVLLIGYSLGADVLPFMINRLPTPARQAIADTVLLSLGHKVDFEFHVSDWLGRNSAQARPIGPELARLNGTPVLCVYGSSDDDSLCADHPVGADIHSLPGDHHFNGDFQTAARLILDHLAKARSTPVSGH